MAGAYKWKRLSELNIYDSFFDSLKEDYPEFEELQLIHGPLQEGGVDGRYRPQALRRHAGRHGQGVLLRDTDVEGPVWESVEEGTKARAVPHGGGDGHDTVILFG